jgi:hypothetical protein
MLENTELTFGMNVMSCSCNKPTADDQPNIFQFQIDGKSFDSLF